MTGPNTTIEGIVVYHGMVDKEQRDTALLKVTEALKLIRQRDPRRWNRIQRDRPAIVIGEGLGSHSYVPSTNTIDLDLRRTLAALTQLLAVSLVHEATHARIARTTERQRLRTMGREREERLCVEEGIAFMRRVARADDPRLESWITEQRKALETPWWTRRAQRRTALRGMEEEGRNPWLVRMAKFLLRE
jgi:hypothetical protein